MSVLTKNQTTSRRVTFQREDGKTCALVAHIRYDDCCGNGHNSFAITGTLFEPERRRGEEMIVIDGKTLWASAGGMLHDLIGEHFPDLRPYLQWHLCSTDGPMHYIANALYWAGCSGYCNGGPNDPPNWDHFRSTVVWGACPTFDVGNPQENNGPRDLQTLLEKRKPELMAAFRAAVESLGFIY